MKNYDYGLKNKFGLSNWSVLMDKVTARSIFDSLSDHHLNEEIYFRH